MISTKPSLIVMLLALFAVSWNAAYAQSAIGATQITTGQHITPTAAAGSTFMPLRTNLRPDGNADAANAVTTALSPDGTKLLVLTTGYNTGFFTVTGTPIVYPVLDPLTGQPTGQTTANAEWVFVYDVTGATPVQLQKINIPRTYQGLTWEPSGQRFYVSGGWDDLVYVYKLAGNSFAPDAPFVVMNTPLQLQNTPAGPQMSAFGLTSYPVVSGLALNGDASTLYVAEYQNDQVALVDTRTRQVTSRITFFTPGGRVPQGEYPLWIVVKPAAGSQPEKVFVSSQRDGQVAVFDQTGTVRFIRAGSEPNRMVLSSDGSTLYVANGDSDSISIIDTAQEEVTGTISLLRPGFVYKGASPNSLALSPQGDRLYVSLGGENALAVVDTASNLVLGRIPTGWYPNSVSVSADGKKLFVVNAKDMPGPNPANNSSAPNPAFRSEYIYALQKSGLLTIPVPDPEQLQALSKIVDSNNGFTSSHESPIMDFLKTRIKHVIYIVKENRTYDEILGDLAVGDGDPNIALYPLRITPNHHKLALDFVTMDRFFTTSEVSGDGWNWTTQARANDYTEKSTPPDYGNGFATLDVFGTDRNVQIGLPAFTPQGNEFNERITTVLDPTGSSNILPGNKDIGATEGAEDTTPGAIGGYIWDEAVRAGKSLRHYGYFTDETYYYVAPPFYIPISRTPFASHIPQGAPLKKTLRDHNDVYYRGFDMSVPDTYHYEEWKREFDQYIAHGNLPSLEVMSLPGDHTGSFSSNVGGLNTPTLEIADNDYALGQIVDAVSHSPYWPDTAIFVVEDDAQDGPDHVDAHRSPAYVISPYTKRNAVVHTFYTQVSIMRTIEDVLGLNHLSLFDANTDPMSDLFVTTPDYTPFSAVIPGVLCKPPVDPNLVPQCHDSSASQTAAAKELHNGAWWANATKEFDFRHPDALNAEAYNRILWKGIMGGKASLPARTGVDLSKDRRNMPGVSTFDSGDGSGR